MALRPDDWDARDERDAEREWVMEQHARLRELSGTIRQLAYLNAHGGGWIVETELAERTRERDEIQRNLAF